jgi:CPA2 family monovalent cation:H+ antiporter-2
MLASHALVLLGVPLRRVVHRVQTARDERYASLRGYFHGASDVLDDAEHMHLRLHSVTLPERARAVGKPVGALGLEEVDAEVASVRRGKTSMNPSTDLVLETGDIVVLRGTADSVVRGEERLLR